MRKRDTEAGFFEVMFEPWALIALAAFVAVCLLLMPFVEWVEPGEIVVCESRFGGGTEVWREPVDGETDAHWQGFCKVTTYHSLTRGKFRQDVTVGENDYAVRGTVFFSLPTNDAALLEIHRAYGSEDGILGKFALPAARQAVQEAAADPDWTKPEGGWAKRQLKGALEYGLKRVSPTGGIWISPEIKKRLQDNLQERLDRVPNPHGIHLLVDLGFVTER